MIYASVCSGVEAASLAWMPLGWKAAWFSEIEPFPCAVLKHRFPAIASTLFANVSAASGAWTGNARNLARIVTS